MNKTATGIALLLLTLLTSSCSIFRPTAAGDGALPERNAKFLMKKLVQQQVKCDWFSARARIDYEDANFGVSVTANLRVRRDSLIWANAKKLNLEVGRALIRPDSIFVIDRINREYSSMSVAEAVGFLRVPANFQILQSILLGNPFFLNTDLTAAVENGFYTLKGEDDRYVATYHLDGKDFSLRKISFAEKAGEREVTMEMKEYQPLVKKQNFSYFRTITANTPEMGLVRIEIEFSKVETDIPKSIEFDIPSRYNETNQP